MFLGQYHLLFDKESRLTIPAHFRGSFSMGGFITQGFDRNLWVLTDAAFQTVCQQVGEMNLADPLARLLLRMVLGQAAELKMDQLGSIQVPQKLREYANLNREILLIGQGDYFEIWDPVLWQEQESQLSDAESNAERFAKLNIALSIP